MPTRPVALSRRGLLGVCICICFETLLQRGPDPLAGPPHGSNLDSARIHMSSAQSRQSRIWTQRCRTRRDAQYSVLHRTHIALQQVIHRHGNRWATSDLGSYRVYG
ncbi:hypothetical protein BT67DRAFT_446110 [Trichocladium antarcticum]|uniref:Secreted protein n=1 Tax=Trichocladium antarcticum TaxID=1450529 RepID=A0AAN6UBJ7_9PEZI|nr:hypothetical protein BT67DRAFT_446110 [Trichocladium antarcticum]